MMIELLRKIEENPVIAAVRRAEDVDEAAASPVSTIFLLHADIISINGIMEKLRKSDKQVCIHVDLLEGIGKDQKAVQYICEVIKPDGIISTRSSVIRFAMDRGMFAVQRFFLIDSQSFETMTSAVKQTKPDMAEIMPALMPDMIRKACAFLKIPVIAGGLVETKQHIIDILGAGAVGVSAGKKSLWTL